MCFENVHEQKYEKVDLKRWHRGIIRNKCKPEKGRKSLTEKDINRWTVIVI